MINPRGWIARLVNNLVRAILLTLCRVDYRELDKIPLTGPAIVVMNHVNFLEVPMVSSLLFPRPCVGLVKKETYKNPLFAFLGQIWGGILIDRNSTDLTAMNLALQSLQSGSILLMAPEGTRSGDGVLREARHGVMLLASRSGAPVIPLGHSGGEQFWNNIKRFQRTQFTIRVGDPVFVPPHIRRADRDVIITTIMGAIAVLLPIWQRGVYGTQDEDNTGKI